jgi:hypothetical protein
LREGDEVVMNTQVATLVLTIVLVVLAIGSSVLIVLQFALPWRSPIGLRERTRRSLVAGGGLAVAALTSLVALDVTASPEAIRNWHATNVVASGCYAIPFGILTAAGSFVGFGVIDALKHQGQVLAKRVRERGAK